MRSGKRQTLPASESAQKLLLRLVTVCRKPAQAGERAHGDGLPMTCNARGMRMRVCLRLRLRLRVCVAPAYLLFESSEARALCVDSRKQPVRRRHQDFPGPQHPPGHATACSISVKASRVCKQVAVGIEWRS